jgi:hypothetical protein
MSSKQVTPSPNQPSPITATDHCHNRNHRLHLLPSFSSVLIITTAAITTYTTQGSWADGLDAMGKFRAGGCQLATDTVADTILPEGGNEEIFLFFEDSPCLCFETVADTILP